MKKSNLPTIALLLSLFLAPPLYPNLFGSKEKVKKTKREEVAEKGEKKPLRPGVKESAPPLPEPRKILIGEIKRVPLTLSMPKTHLSLSLYKTPISYVTIPPLKQKPFKQEALFFSRIALSPQLIEPKKREKFEKQRGRLANKEEQFLPAPIGSREWSKDALGAFKKYQEWIFTQTLFYKLPSPTLDTFLTHLIEMNSSCLVEALEEDLTASPFSFETTPQPLALSSAPIPLQTIHPFRSKPSLTSVSPLPSVETHVSLPTTLLAPHSAFHEIYPSCSVGSRAWSQDLLGAFEKESDFLFTTRLLHEEVAYHQSYTHLVNLLKYSLPFSHQEIALPLLCVTPNAPLKESSSLVLQKAPLSDWVDLPPLEEYDIDFCFSFPPAQGIEIGEAPPLYKVVPLNEPCSALSLPKKRGPHFLTLSSPSWTNNQRAFIKEVHEDSLLSFPFLSKQTDLIPTFSYTPIFLSIKPTTHTLSCAIIPYEMTSFSLGLEPSHLKLTHTLPFHLVREERPLSPLSLTKDSFNEEALFATFPTEIPFKETIFPTSSLLYDLEIASFAFIPSIGDLSLPPFTPKTYAKEASYNLSSCYTKEDKIEGLSQKALLDTCSTSPFFFHYFSPTPFYFFGENSPLLFHASFTESIETNRTYRLTQYQLSSIPSLNDLDTDSLSEDFKTEAKIYPLKEGGFIFGLHLSLYDKRLVEPFPSHVYYILDRSSSIESHRFDTYKLGILQSLEYLGKDTSFNVYVLDSTFSPLFPEDLPPTNASYQALKKAFQTLKQGRNTSLLTVKHLLTEIKEKSLDKNETYTLIFLSDGKFFKSIRFDQEHLKNLLALDAPNLSLYALPISDNNNIPMLTALARLNRGDLLHSQTHAALPRKLSTMVKKLNTPIISYTRAMIVNPKTPTSLVDAPLFPTIFSDRGFTLYGYTQDLKDLDLLIQGKGVARWFNIRKQISLSKAEKGENSLQKEYFRRKMHAQLFDYLLTGNPQNLSDFSL